MSLCLYGYEPKIKLALPMPLYGYGRDPEHHEHGLEVSKLNQKFPISPYAPMSGGFWSSDISRMLFPKKLGWTTPHGCDSLEHDMWSSWSDVIS